ncbi:MAG: radical SAM protein, partial [Planctomycetota bacterium]
QRRFRFGPLLDTGETSRAEDGTRKYLFRALSDHRGVEVVLVRNRNAVTLCLSSQAGCALGCTFCATAQMGLERHLTAGEITEAKLRAESAAGVRVSDVVFMGQGEPLHNYDAVMDACTNLNHDLGPHISSRASASRSPPWGSRRRSAATRASAAAGGSTCRCTRRSRRRAPR